MKYLYAEYVPAFKAISDETCLKIIDMLSCGKTSTAVIKKIVDKQQSAWKMRRKYGIKF